MIGHTRGHAAVAVETPDGFILHSGDAYFDHREMDVDRPRCSRALAAFEHVIAVQNRARLANAARLRELARDYAGKVRVFCAHSLVELDALRAASEPLSRAAE